MLVFVAAPSWGRLCRSAMPPPTDAHLPRGPCQRGERGATDTQNDTHSLVCGRNPSELMRRVDPQSAASQAARETAPVVQHTYSPADVLRPVVQAARIAQPSSRRTITTTRRHLCRLRHSTSTPRSVGDAQGGQEGNERMSEPSDVYVLGWVMVCCAVQRLHLRCALPSWLRDRRSPTRPTA